MKSSYPWSENGYSLTRRIGTKSGRGRSSRDVLDCRRNPLSEGPDATDAMLSESLHREHVVSTRAHMDKAAAAYTV